MTYYDHYLSDTTNRGFLLALGRSSGAEAVGDSKKNRGCNQPRTTCATAGHFVTRRMAAAIHNRVKTCRVLVS
jgi:hypothetical protein